MDVRLATVGGRHRPINDDDKLTKATTWLDAKRRLTPQTGVSISHLQLVRWTAVWGEVWSRTPMFVNPQIIWGSVVCYGLPNNVVPLLKLGGQWTKRSSMKWQLVKLKHTLYDKLQRALNVATQVRFPFKSNRLRCVRCVRCVNENRKKRKRLRFLRFSFINARNARNASDCFWMETGLHWPSRLLHFDLHWLDVSERTQNKLRLTAAPVSATQQSPDGLLYTDFWCWRH